LSNIIHLLFTWNLFEYDKVILVYEAYVAYTRPHILIRQGHIDMYNIWNVRYMDIYIYIYIYIYILYNYKLYKLIIKIYVYKYNSIFLAEKIFLMTGSKEFVFYFYNHNKILYNKFEFLENSYFFPF